MSFFLAPGAPGGQNGRMGAPFWLGLVGIAVTGCVIWGTVCLRAARDLRRGVRDGKARRAAALLEAAADHTETARTLFFWAGGLTLVTVFLMVLMWQ